jgi:hypothetical protein
MNKIYVKLCYGTSLAEKVISSVCLDLKRAWLGRAVKWYRLVFGSEMSRGGACSGFCFDLKERAGNWYWFFWNRIGQGWVEQLTGTGLCLELKAAGVKCALNWLLFVFGAG